jgi:hypothetical protein
MTIKLLLLVLQETSTQIFLRNSLMFKLKTQDSWRKCMYVQN